MDRKNIIKNIVDLIKEQGLQDGEVGIYFSKLREDVLSKYFEDSSGIYVVKRNGRLEPFSNEKIYYSIANASDDANMKMNTSDINGVINSVTGALSDKKIITTGELRQLVTNALKANGFSDVRYSYLGK